MDSESNQEALNFLRSMRAEDTSSTPEAQEDHTDAEADNVEAEEDQNLEEVEVESEDSEEAAEEVEESYYLIDDEEITLDQIREWKNGYLRQSDYTQKTQSLAAERKELEGIQSKSTEKLNKLDSKIQELEALIQSDEQQIDWDNLIEEDPSQYLKLQKKQAKRREALKVAEEKKAAEHAAARQKYLEQQMVNIRERMPDWMDAGGQATETMQKDISAINGYLSSKGFSSDDINQAVDARLWDVFRDAVRYQNLKGAKPSVDKKLKKAPKVIKPSKGVRKAPNLSMAEEAAKKLRESGSEKDALAYLKAKRT